MQFDVFSLLGLCLGRWLVVGRSWLPMNAMELSFGWSFSVMAGGSIVLMRDVLFCLHGLGVVAFFCGWSECCAVCFLPLLSLPRNMRMRRRSMPQ